MATHLNGQRCVFWYLVTLFLCILLQPIMTNADLEISRTYLHVRLLNELTGEKTEITYIMNQHSVARRFEFLAHRHLLYSHEIQSLAWAVFPKGRDALVKTHDELKAHMDFIDNFRHNGQSLFQFKHKLPPLGQCSVELYLKLLFIDHTLICFVMLTSC